MPQFELTSSNHGDPQTLTLQGYAEDIHIDLKPYSGLDFSKLAVMFCGQGQMLPGLMADEVQHFPLFQVHFKELDQIATKEGLGAPSDFILKPDKVPKERMILYSSLCLYTLQVSMFETLQMLRYRPRILTAHSFGEFAALTAAGVIRFGDMIRFLIERQKILRQLPGQFAMFAVNDVSKLSQISVDFEYHIANFNTLKQSSIVCQAKDADSLKGILKEQRMAAVRVEVDYPYHTPWLNTCAALLKDRITTLELKIESPKIPIVSSVSGQILDKGNFGPEKIQRLLCDQLITPVRFPDQVRTVLAAGMAHFVELSPVDVLSPFVEQILSSDQKTFKVDSFRRRVKAMAPRSRSTTKFKNSKLLDVFNRALKSLSGYTVEDIHLEDRIREDLGIDSIKKAEIVFQIVDSMNNMNAGFTAPVNLSDLATFGDIIDYLEASVNSKETLAASTLQKRKDFELLQRQWVDLPVVDFVGRDPLSVQIISMQDLRLGRASLPAATEAETVAVLQCDIQVNEENQSEEAKWWLNYFRTHRLEHKRWLLLHSGCVFGYALHAMFNSLAQETQVSFKGVANLSEINLSADTLVRESLDFYHSEVRINKNGKRQVRQFVKAVNPSTTALKGAPPKRVLIFGGLGGVGQNLIRSFEKQPLEELLIVGRQSENEKIKATLAELKSSALSIKYQSLNVLDRKDLDAFLKRALTQGDGFDLVIHSVGREFSEVLANTSTEHIDEILDGKLILAQALYQAAKAHPNIRFVLNSSIIPEFGNAGQTPYGMVNQFLNEYARRTPNMLAILWPAWDRTGMTNHDLILKSLQLLGLPVLQPESGRELFQQALNWSTDTLYPLCFDYLSDYLSVGSSRSEFKGLFRFASKDRHLHALTGLTLKNLPYLTHHIVKKICPFPASGSLALMLFKGYQERGLLGQVKNFKALNFLIVQQETSPYFLESSYTGPDELYAQVRSSQLLAESKIDFATRSQPKANLDFTSDLELEIEFDQNVSVYIGPLFKLEQGIFEDSKTGRMVVRMDLAKTPHYSGVHIFDKLHKLFEISFNTSCLKAVRDLGLMIVPKSIQTLTVHPENLTGTLFYVTIDQMKNQSDGPLCDLTVVNAKGQPAIEIQDLRSIIVSREQGESAKEVRQRPHVEKFF